MPLTAAQQRIQQQRQLLETVLSTPLRYISSQCADVIDKDKSIINETLQSGMKMIPYCHSIYIMDLNGEQISDSIERNGDVIALAGQDRSERPYLNIVPTVDFLLSESYISNFSRKPSLTAVQIIRVDQQAVGFVAALFELKNLPLTAALYEEPTHWRQLKGDPSIRGTLFQQQRTESVIDQHIQNVMAVLHELITERGIFHTEIHFSSNRAIVWPNRVPCKYHILTLDDLMDTDICLAYAKNDYSENSVIPKEKIEQILKMFIDLRFVDETIYLRTGTINTHNGLIGLTFSCDGSHYMHYDEFISKSLLFWLGEAQAGTSIIP
ncbi:MAG: PDC sensor domain-containing protein [Gammaproteobacteria bacterium]|nr:PDC sensor domain-containing protein [Gammaproteobacteria bacterium]